MFIRKKLAEFKPSNRFFFNVHLDGMRKSHDIAVEREGVFDAAIDGIKAAKETGFLVCTNTTVFNETDMAELDEMFGYLTELGVDGFMISPGYDYSAVKVKEIFLTRDDDQGQVQAGRGDVPQVQVQHVADLSRVPPGQARAATARPGRRRRGTSRAGRARAT